MEAGKGAEPRTQLGDGGHSDGMVAREKSVSGVAISLGGGEGHLTGATGAPPPPSNNTASLLASFPVTLRGGWGGERERERAGFLASLKRLFRFFSVWRKRAATPAPARVTLT